MPSRIADEHTTAGFATIMALPGSEITAVGREGLSALQRKDEELGLASSRDSAQRGEVSQENCF